MNKAQLREVMQKSIEIQRMLFERIETESDRSKEWTAYQIAYQKSVYKAAMHAMGGGYVVNGIKPCSDSELVEYYNQLCKNVA